MKTVHTKQNECIVFSVLPEVFHKFGIYPNRIHGNVIVFGEIGFRGNLRYSSHITLYPEPYKMGGTYIRTVASECVAKLQENLKSNWGLIQYVKRYIIKLPNVVNIIQLYIVIRSIPTLFIRFLKLFLPNQLEFICVCVKNEIIESKRPTKIAEILIIEMMTSNKIRIRKNQLSVCVCHCL